MWLLACFLVCTGYLVNKFKSINFLMDFKNSSAINKLNKQRLHLRVCCTMPEIRNRCFHQSLTNTASYTFTQEKSKKVSK